MKAVAFNGGDPVKETPVLSCSLSTTALFSIIIVSSAEAEPGATTSDGASGLIDEPDAIDAACPAAALAFACSPSLSSSALALETSGVISFAAAVAYCCDCFKAVALYSG